MCNLHGGTGCYVQSLGTIPNVGDAVRANHLIAVKHSHRVLSIRVPVSMLSARLDVVELAMPRTTSFLNLVFPSMSRL
jgi:hypothetical protein